MLETLRPAERLAFVLHDCSPCPLTRSLRVPDADLERQREVVDAFLAGLATQSGAHQRRRRDRLDPGRAAVLGRGRDGQGGRIVEIDILSDPERLGELDLAILDD